MATTMYFHKEVKDAAGGDVKMYIEIGRSSFTRENRVYIQIGEDAVQMDKETEKEFFDGMHSLGVYLGHY